ncbi:MAG: hypothetical protein WBL02_03420 [Methanomethylovorans sp.]|uniref:hypothetical protein n=1 Tax=Methanomethylovorans sp. TaxID=2758717 RepID=UPI000B04780A|nr:hypothetical protein [Methanomethylovorans sp.]
MFNIFKQLTITPNRLQIIEILNIKGPLRFSEIKAAMEGKNDNTINRELKKLMNTEPPIIVKNKDKLYSLNQENQLVKNLSCFVDMLPFDTDHMRIVSSVDEYNENIGYGFIVSSSHVDGFEDELTKIVESQKEFMDYLNELYFDTIRLKISKMAENKIKKGEIKEEDISSYIKEISDSVFEEGIIIQIIPINRFKQFKS